MSLDRSTFSHAKDSSAKIGSITEVDKVSLDLSPSRKLLNKRNSLTYGAKLAVLRVHPPVSSVQLAGERVYERRVISRVCAFVHTDACVAACIAGVTVAAYIGSNPAHSALMNMPEHDGSTLCDPGTPPPLSVP